MISYRTFKGVAPAGVSLFFFLAPLFSADASASTGDKVGWIENTRQKEPTSSLVRVIRNGVEVAYSDSEGLRSCDRLQLVNAEATLRVTLSNAQRLTLSASRPEVEVPCKTQGLAEHLGNLIQAITGPAETRRDAIAASRSAAPPIDVPVLVAETAALAAGPRAIFVSWRGGVAPFRVEILRTADDGKVVSIVSRHNVRERAVTLPEARFPAGRYSLVITGADTGWTREDKLDFVPVSSVPAMPAELKEAKLAESARALFYADFLVGFGDGRFTFEALQTAAAISPATQASKEWLNAWGAGK